MYNRLKIFYYFYGKRDYYKTKPLTCKYLIDLSAQFSKLIRNI